MVLVCHCLDNQRLDNFDTTRKNHAALTLNHNMSPFPAIPGAPLSKAAHIKDRMESTIISAIKDSSRENRNSAMC